MVGVEHCLVVATEREPGHPAMKELGELAIRLVAVFLVHRPGRSLTPWRLSATGRTVAEIIEISRKPMRSCTVGTPGDFELKHAQLDTNLQDAPPVAST